MNGLAGGGSCMLDRSGNNRTDIDGPPEFDGLLQFSSALSHPQIDRSRGGRENRFRANSGFILSRNDVENFRQRLSRQFEGCVAGFGLEQCYGTPDWRWSGSKHSWLGRDSRHAAISVPKVFHNTIEDDFPRLLRWSALTRGSVSAGFDTFLRVQRSKGGMRRPFDSFDCNDYLLREQHIVPDDLAILQKFFAILYAQRRSRLFASDLSERVYNVWLPPALISTQTHREDGFALLPFATLVRSPFRRRFRDTLTLSFILAPVHLKGST